MKPSPSRDPGLNPAAALVIGILGLVAAATTGTLCAIALRTNDAKDPKEIAVFCLGAISGVLAKTGYDLVRAHVGPGSGDADPADDPPATPPPAPESQTRP